MIYKSGVLLPHFTASRPASRALLFGGTTGPFLFSSGFQLRRVPDRRAQGEQDGLRRTTAPGVKRKAKSTANSGGSGTCCGFLQLDGALSSIHQPACCNISAALASLCMRVQTAVPPPGCRRFSAKLEDIQPQKTKGLETVTAHTENQYFPC